MATQIVSDAYMKSLLKTVYLDGVYNNKYQNSPVLSAINKESWDGGKEIKYAAQYSNGGNFGSNYAALVADPTTGAKNIEWAMEQGYLTGFFTVDQPELLTSASDRGAYMKILSNKMAAAFDGMSKLLATYMYGGAFGVIDQVAADIALSGTTHTIPLTSAGAIKLDIGSRFVVATEGVANTALPSSALYGSGTVFTVTGIDDTTITATTASSQSGTLYAGDYIELYTSRNVNTPLGPEGLADLIPSVADRSGSVWSTYIGTNFRGIDRSVASNRLAGQFVKAAASGDTRLTDALVSLLKKTKRAGGLNNVVILNDEAWDKIGAELDIQKNLWQAINSGENKNSFTAGYSNLATAFGDAFINRTIIDPFCPEDKSYMLEKEDFKFYDLGNVGKVLSPVANDQLGKHDIEAVGDQGVGNEIGPKLNWDKLFNIEQGTAGVYGPTMRISTNIYGNFALRKTASAGVAILK